MKRVALSSLTLVASIVLGGLSASAAEQQFITIGTGGVTGVYYPAGGAICRLVNRGKKEHGIRCSVESTGGSVYNINTIRNGGLDLGIAQSDWQFHAYNGTSSFAEAGPFKELRSVFSLHAEPVTVIARRDAGITGIDGLVGKRVNIGNPGSGTEATWNVMWAALGHSNADLALAAQMNPAETPRALCANKIDAIFYPVGHPNGVTKEATINCDAVLVDVAGPAIDKLVQQFPYYQYATIPGGMYRGNPEDVRVFGVRATVVTSTRLPAETVYQLVKAVFDHFDTFKKLHPAFAQLKESEMIKDALTAPLHDGAVRYYKERGWM